MNVNARENIRLKQLFGLIHPFIHFSIKKNKKNTCKLNTVRKCYSKNSFQIISVFYILEGVMSMKSIVLTAWKTNKVKCKPKYNLARKFITIVKICF